MSVGGKIIEKRLMTIDGTEVLRYLVMHEYRPDWFEETYVYAKRAEEEPKLGEAIWWQAGTIYFGQNDSKRLAKVGYSFKREGDAA
jgi:hypothetical protein